MNSASMIIIILLCLSLILASFVIYINNIIVNARNKVIDKFNPIREEISKRWELLNSLILILKDYDEVKGNDYINIVNNSKFNPTEINDIVEADKLITNCIKGLFTTIDNYPKIKDNDKYKDIYDKLISCEDRLSYAREFYNEFADNYNELIKVFPNNIISYVFKYFEYICYK